MYKALSIHKIRQNTKMPTFYKTLYLDHLLSISSLTNLNTYDTLSGDDR
jgi:hypothetical protein